MHFGISEKPTTDTVSLYNNAGLISKVSGKIAIGAGLAGSDCDFRKISA